MISDAGTSIVLGPELETYRSDKMVVVTAAAEVLAPVAAICAACWSDDLDSAAKCLDLALLAGPLLYIAWLYSRRVTLHVDGITYHTLFGEQEMRWDLVERFDYRATHRRFPLATRYRFTLHEAGRSILRVGKGIAHAAKLGERLREFTTPPLLRKCLVRFNGGEDLDFGAVRLSRVAGIRIKKRNGEKVVLLDQVNSCAIQNGRLQIEWSDEQTLKDSWELNQLTNSFALLALLQTVAHPIPRAAG